MMREPWFWRSTSIAARVATALMTPVAYAYQGAHQLRWKLTRPARVSVPVICIGNATLGGAGKTPFAMLAAELLQEEGVRTAFLTRGYGGELAGPIAVDPNRHDADDVGDEALLLARRGPVIVARNRPAGARLAIERGAQAIIMDDGYQNPSLHKDVSILLIGADEQTSNGALFPAGPFRESVNSASTRAQITVSISGHDSDADFTAWLAPENPPPPERVVAFAGIGRPQKFFATLQDAGFDIADRIAFPDHHKFRPADIRELQKRAAQANARLICTEKDFVRLPDEIRKDVLAFPVTMQVDDRAGLKQRLMRVINQSKPTTPGRDDDAPH